ncbi:MAG: MBG domain-containing protein, partial [Planctomycetota bacterium]
TSTLTGFVNSETVADITVGTVTFTGAATTDTDAGTYAITPVLSGFAAANYDFAVADGALTINKATLTVNANNQTRTYSAATYTAFTSSITGFVNSDTDAVISGAITYAGTAASAINVGTSTITPVVSGLTATNYVFVAGSNGTLTTNKATLTVTADDKSKTYNGATFTAFTSTVTGYAGSDSASSFTGAVTYSGTATTGKNVGTYTITPVISALTSSNYTFTAANGTLTVNKATLTVTAANKVKTYDGKTMTKSGSSAYFDGVNDYISVPQNTVFPVGNTSYTLEAWIKPEVQDGKIISFGSAAQNQWTSLYFLNLNNTKQINIDWGNNGYSVVCGDLVDGLWHHIATTYNGSTRSIYIDGVFKGSAASTGHNVLSTNLNIQIGNGYKGTMADVRVWNVARSASDISTNMASVSPSSTGLVANYLMQDMSGTTVANSATASTGIDGTLVNGATWAGAFTSTISGYVNSETATSITTGTVSYTGTATTATQAGTHAITPVLTGYSATNYDFATIDGTLTINKAVLTVTPDNKTTSYTASAFTGFTSTFSGLATGDTASVATGAIVYGGTAATAVNYSASTYPITTDVSGLTADNYTFVAGANGALTINKAVLTVTANNTTKTYDGRATSAFSSAITGFQGSDTANMVTGNLTYSGTATTSTAAGTYVITPVVSNLVANANYSFAAANGSLVINKATLKVSATNIGKITDGKAVSTSGASANALTQANTTTLTVTGATIRAITNDGSKIYIYTNGSIKEYNYSGTLLATRTGLSFGSEANMAYAKGFIYLRNTSTNIIYRISTTTWTSSAVTVDSTKPLFIRSGLGNTIFDMPNGQIGVTSTTTARFYNVSADGLTFTWDRDVTIPDSWNNDQHGISSDGTYLYSIHYSNGYKSYNLITGAVAYYGTSSGTLYTMRTAGDGGTINNPCFMTRDHVTGKYIIGDFNNPKLLISGPAALSFSSTISGYVNSETSSVVSGSVTYSGDATTATASGLYAITPVISGLSATNYTFAAVDGKLAISAVGAAAPTVTWATPSAINYSDALSATQLNASAGGVAGTFTYNPDLGTVLNAGAGQTLSVTFTPDDLINYTQVNQTTTLTVNKQVITVTADPKSKVYNKAVYTGFTSTYSGFVNGETASVIS